MFWKYSLFNFTLTVLEPFLASECLIWETSSTCFTSFKALRKLSFSSSASYIVDCVGVTSYSSFTCCLTSEMNKCLGSDLVDDGSIDMEFNLIIPPLLFFRYSEVLKAFVALKSKGFGIEKDLVAFVPVPPSSQSSMLSLVVVTSYLFAFLTDYGCVMPKRRLFPARRVIFPLVYLINLLSKRWRLKSFCWQNIFFAFF